MDQAINPVATPGADPLPFSGRAGSLTYFGEPRIRSGPGPLVWAVGIIVIVVMGVAILLPSLCRSSETANRVKCASNLRQIGQAIALYAQANGGQYPPSLAGLAAQEELSPAMMVCPSSNDEPASTAETTGFVAQLTAAETNAAEHKHCLSYIYVGSKLNASTAMPDTLVAYEPMDDHNGNGTNALFADGHVEFLQKAPNPSGAKG